MQTKLDYFKKNGWGYTDSEFIIDRKREIGSFSGSRYLYAGHELPGLKDFCVDHIGAEIDKPKHAQADMEADPPQNVNHEFLEELEKQKIFSRRSFMKWERIMHSHGASLREIFNLRYLKFEKCVDCVVYPSSTEHVVKIVALAHKHNVVLIPYGGGTNVT